MKMPRVAAHWEHFAHAADVGIRGFGSSVARGRDADILPAAGAVLPCRRPAPAIVAEAVRQQAQLIVLGSRGANDYWGPRLGSIALQVARAAPCSVLVVRQR